MGREIKVLVEGVCPQGNVVVSKTSTVKLGVAKIENNPVKKDREKLLKEFGKAVLEKQKASISKTNMRIVKKHGRVDYEVLVYTTNEQLLARKAFTVHHLNS